MYVCIRKTMHIAAIEIPFFARINNYKILSVLVLVNARECMSKFIHVYVCAHAAACTSHTYLRTYIHTDYADM
jgi:hypothetical protein